MKNLFIILILSPFIFSCSSTDEIVNSKWTFIACEGNYGSSNGSIYMIKRIDDADETIVKRYDAYMNITKPVLDYYSSNVNLKTLFPSI